MEKFLNEQALQRLKGGVDVARKLYVKHRPVKPRIKKNIALSGIMGLLFGVILAFILEYGKKTTKDVKKDE